MSSNLLNCVVFLFFLLSCSSRSENVKNNHSEAILVSLLALTSQETPSIIETTGLFSTDDETLLSFKNGGVIDKIYVKEGDLVQNGQLLASLNKTELLAKETQAKLAVEKAQRDFERIEKLYRDSVATYEQYQNIQTYLEVTKQDLTTIQFNLKYSEIRATMSGYVLLKLANEGQIIGQGMPVLQINGAKRGNWIVKIGLSDKQWSKVEIGDSALITTDAFSDTLHGKIVRKTEGLNPNSNTFIVHVQVDQNPKLPIASGMFAKVKVFGKTAQVWRIPYRALIDGETNSGAVFVTHDSLTARKIPVEVHAIEKNNILIASGLENYKHIIIEGSAYLKDGSKIKIAPAN